MSIKFAIFLNIKICIISGCSFFIIIMKDNWKFAD